MFEPYAAKAIIQHEFDTDHLNVWITFRFPMNQNVKPADTVWLVKVDDVIKAVSSSAWQDAYTMLLVVGSIASSPARVLVSFDGPDDNLEMTWHKNWQPWGYILSEYTGVSDQSLKTTDSPTFANLNLTAGALNSNTAANIKLFEVLPVDNAADGQSLYVYRNAAEGKDYLRFYIDQYRTCCIYSNAGFYIRSVTGSVWFNPATYVRFTPGSSYYTYFDNFTGKGIQIRNASGAYAVVATWDNLGRLRLGDANAPTEMLDVVGNGKISGTLNVAGLTTPSGGLKFRTAASDPQDATPANRPAGVVAEQVYYNGKMYFCTDAAIPTWEKITSS